MGNERVSKRMPSTPKIRRRLSDITNLPTSAGRADSGDDSSSNHLQKNHEFQLQKDVAILRKMIIEKDATIQAQAAHIQKLSTDLRQKSAQNEELIQHYCRLYKDFTQARDELKLRQHEYSQMTIVYKIDKSELQLKLAEINEQLNQLLQEKLNRDNINANASSTEVKPVRPKMSRRHSTSLGLDLNRASFSPAKGSTSRHRHLVGLKMLQKLEEESVLLPNVRQPTVSSTLAQRLNKEQKQQPIKSMLSINSSDQTNPSGTLLNRLSGRPVRKSTVVVASYKEPPLNTKMRRPS
ncbi:hypothetical protein O6H91_21G063800 [Diphasiastrum complanatum]|uniref:Uncharacterized protein n=1 Tax=Diphasiastrum complanatum TaxID=34168 RepID=A0ACC2AMY1_DIPCM|nr:hypothetical protein O6H91_Y401900 [Diphasiastrum complanatum]KAJ7518319.1 hypothetical protein O6H91_21G063800 [Diphasiastrum complanatum]